MRLTLNLPAESARRLGIEVSADTQSVILEMSHIELAGRLTLATGTPMDPKQAMAYARASGAATDGEALTAPGTSAPFE
jgi:hypothetical protein